MIILLNILPAVFLFCQQACKKIDHTKAFYQNKTKNLALNFIKIYIQVRIYQNLFIIYPLHHLHHHLHFHRRHLLKILFLFSSHQHLLYAAVLLDYNAAYVHPQSLI